MILDRTYCDFLAVAPLEIECDALIASLKSDGWIAKNVSDHEFRSIWEVVAEDINVATFKRHAVVIQLNHQGVLNASIDTARILQLYEPGCVISFGIAGSFNESDAPIGSVIYAAPLFYYEPSADRDNDTNSRMQSIPVSEYLRNKFLGSNGSTFKKVSGPIASGEKLFADIDSRARKRILSTNDKTLAAEMEAAGVGIATHRLLPSAEFIVIKGISDLADKKKKKISEEAQLVNRSTAAQNAASATAALMRSSPLRRRFRSIPNPHEDDWLRNATREAQSISEILHPYGISAHFITLQNCLYGRRGPIPLYFHWEQYTPALHWIDFKILTAIRALPENIVTPIPLVTVMDGLPESQGWADTVQSIVGVAPITNRHILEQLDELSDFIARVGFTATAQTEILRELENIRETGTPEVTLNLMRYMLGQFCHRRMFIFTWKSYRAKWEKLSRALGTWFSIFDWDDFCLDKQRGKQTHPGQGLVIEPCSHRIILEWAESEPEESTTLRDFVEHFKCHLSESDWNMRTYKDRLNALLAHWDSFLCR